MSEKTAGKGNGNNCADDILQSILQDGEIFVDELTRDFGLSVETVL